MITKEGTRKEAYSLDTYATLEFQGFVATTPKYDKRSGRLAFKAHAYGSPIMEFVAFGAIAKAFKGLLYTGVLIQMQAKAKRYERAMNSSKVSVVIWEATRLAIIGHKRFKLGNYEDVEILDNLMPNDICDDVGYVKDETRWNE